MQALLFQLYSPFNIKTGETYSVYLGIGNYMGSSSSYTCYIKIRNETEPLPDPVLGTPSPLPVLYEYKAFIQNEGKWESPLTFRIDDLTVYENMSYLTTITVNGKSYPVNEASAWNANKTGYYYSLFTELWIYDTAYSRFQYNNRSVNLILNVTKSA